MGKNLLNLLDSFLTMTAPAPLSADNDPRHASTCALPSDALAAEMLGILDQHMADLKAGRAVSRAELVSRVRGAAPTPALRTISQSPASGNNRAAASTAARTSLAPTRWQPDERWSRDLPWAFQKISLAELFWNLGWLSLLSALLIIVPVYYVYLLIHRQFSLKMLLGLPIVAGLFLLAMFIEVPHRCPRSARTEAIS